MIEKMMMNIVCDDVIIVMVMTAIKYLIFLSLN